MEKEAHKEESSRPILFEADEFDVDSFNVKPLSKGLGFHQERQKGHTLRKQFKSSQPQQKPLSRQTEITVGPSRHSGKSTSTSDMFWDQTVSQSELSQFYQQGSPSDSLSGVQKNEQKPSQKAEMIVHRATPVSRLLAWTLDMLFLGVICLGLVFSFITFAGMNVDLLLKGHYLGHVELILFSLGLFSLLYIFYFTILDMAASPGKSLMNLRVCSANGERPKASQTLIRSVVGLFSIFLLGLPAILDFQSRLSDSLVSQDNENA